MRWIAVILVCFFLSSCAGCLSSTVYKSAPAPSQPSQTTPAQDSYIEYSDVDYHFSFQYPKDWNIQVVNEKIQRGNQHTVILKGNNLDKGGTIMISDNPSGLTFEKMIENWKNDAKNDFKDFKLVSESRITVDGTDAFRVEYTTTEIQQKPWHFVLVSLVKNNYMIIINLGTGTENFSREQQSINTIISSLKFT